MRLTVEFLGLARRLAQAKDCLLQMDDAVTYVDVLRTLAETYPSLVGPVVNSDADALAPSYMLNLNGRLPVRDFCASPKDGDRLILMFVEAGG